MCQQVLIEGITFRGPSLGPYLSPRVTVYHGEQCEKDPEEGPDRKETKSNLILGISPYNLLQTDQDHVWNSGVRIRLP